MLANQEEAGVRERYKVRSEEEEEEEVEEVVCAAVAASIMKTEELCRVRAPRPAGALIYLTPLVSG